MELRDGSKNKNISGGDSLLSDIVAEPPLVVFSSPGHLVPPVMFLITGGIYIYSKPRTTSLVSSLALSVELNFHPMGCTAITFPATNLDGDARGLLSFYRSYLPLSGGEVWEKHGGTHTGPPKWGWGL